ncbi:MAG: thioredoxin family protein [Sterolibacteriaceae bacterium MAG5]|nr:thioredoxin family protein [Candidatus Nitricoxidireducens bremensis]
MRQVESARQSGLPTVVEFGSEACASCRTMQRVMAGVARKAEGRAQVLVMDILKQDGLIGAYRIKMMPTQVFFDAAGRETGRHMGVLTEAEVLARLQVKEP